LVEEHPGGTSLTASSSSQVWYRNQLNMEREMNRKFRAFLMLMFLSTIALSPYRYSENPNQAISFDSVDVLTIKTSEDTKFIIHNNTNEEITGLDITYLMADHNADPLKFDFEDTLAKAKSQIVTVSVDTNGLEPGKTYNGTITASTPINDTVIHRDFQIVYEQEETLITNVEPLVSEWTQKRMIYDRNQPVHRCEQNCELPIKPPADKNKELSTEPIGYLVGDRGGKVVVKLEDIKYLDGNSASLVLGFGTIAKHGIYSGKIDFYPDDDKKGDVTFTLEVSHNIWWVIWVLIIGIAIVVTIQYFSEVMYKIIKNFLAHKEIEVDYQEFIEGSPTLKYSTEDAYHDSLKKIKSDNGKLWFNYPEVEKEEQEQIELAIHNLKEYFGAWKGFPKALNDLETELEGIKTTVNDYPTFFQAKYNPNNTWPEYTDHESEIIFRGGDPPDYVNYGEKLLIPGDPYSKKLTWTDFESLKTSVSVGTELSKTWCKLDESIVDLVVRLIKLEEFIDKNKYKAPYLWNKFIEAESQVSKLRWYIWNVDKPEDLNEFIDIDEIMAAESDIFYLEKEKDERLRGKAPSRRMTPHLRTTLDSIRIEAIKKLDIIKTQIIVVDAFRKVANWVFLIFTFALAVYLALEVVYLEKDVFGSRWDYVAALAVGITTKTIFDRFDIALGRMLHGYKNTNSEKSKD
jgi:hypothetical protein